MKMHNPPHPGEILKELWLSPLELSITEAAKGLGVSRANLSSIVNGKTNISPEMAIRIAKAFGSNAQTWLNMQMQYDLYYAEKESKKIKVKKFKIPKHLQDSQTSH